MLPTKFGGGGRVRSSLTVCKRAARCGPGAITYQVVRNVSTSTCNCVKFHHTRSPNAKRNTTPCRICRSPPDRPPAIACPSARARLRCRLSSGRTCVDARYAFAKKACTCRPVPPCPIITSTRRLRVHIRSLPLGILSRQPAALVSAGPTLRTWHPSGVRRGVVVGVPPPSSWRRPSQ